jgi:tetratricopeptide (TPR) repeat protein
MVRCPRCGTDSPDQSRFCRACGEALAGRAAGAAAQAPPAEERARRLLEEAFRLSEEGRLLAAIQTCQQAVAINPNSTSAHSLLGTLYERQGDRDGAIREYEQVLTLSPGSTVERRRLNELMGVPASREAVAGISPRTARLAVTGSAAVVAVVLIGAIVMTLQQPPRPERPAAQNAPTGPAVAQQQNLAPSEAASYAPSPGNVYYNYNAPRAQAPRFNAPRAFAQRPQPQQNRYAYGGGQWVAPGTYAVPMTAAQRPAAPFRVAAAPAPPFAGAVRVYSATPPTVASPGWQGGGAPFRGVSPDAGRNYYFQGDYQRAIDAYQAYMYQNPNAGADTREELAWVYTEAGDRNRANQQYRIALDEYQSDLSRGLNVEAARHGARTCDSALKALEK